MVLGEIRQCHCRMDVQTYLWVELELDHVTSLCLDVAGVERKRSVGSSDLNGVCDETIA